MLLGATFQAGSCEAIYFHKIVHVFQLLHGHRDTPSAMTSLLADMAVFIGNTSNFNKTFTHITQFHLFEQTSEWRPK